jgi:hypothetical protein
MSGSRWIRLKTINSFFLKVGLWAFKKTTKILCWFERSKLSFLTK